MYVFRVSVIAATFIVIKRDDIVFGGRGCGGVEFGILEVCGFLLQVD